MIDHQCGLHCSCWYLIGALFWFAALVSLIFAWVATAQGTVWGLDASHWYGDALVLGVLAIPLKLKRHAASCNCGMCEEPRKR